MPAMPVPEPGPAGAPRIRDTTDDDIAAVCALHREAFGGDAEAALVEGLHAAGAARVSLLAEAGGVIAGHVLFSPATVDGLHIELAGLAPMAVLPSLQRRGVGARLVEAGLARCRALGIDAVVVLGHAAYYPRFGFRPASGFGLTCDWDVPDEAFMAQEIRPGALAGGGRVHYHPLFSEI